MNPRVALIIGALAAAVFGLMLTFLPGQMLSGFGLPGSPDALILSRDVGVTLLGVAILNWLGRDATGSALRAILIGNLAIQVLEFLVNGYELAIGVLPSSAAGGELIHIVLGVVFLLALRRVGPTTAM
jgi:hypothetical protein